MENLFDRRAERDSSSMIKYNRSFDFRVQIDLILFY